MSSDLVGLIPAAGWGVRAYPYTRTVPKSMLEVDGVPLIERNVTLLRDQLDIAEIVIVVGYRGEVIRDHLGDGRRLGVRIRYAQNDRVELNLPYSVYLGSREIDGPCCMILADESYVGTNHRALLTPAFRAASAVCAIVEGASARAIRKNYVATVRDGRIVGLEEKPRVVQGSQMGTGTYLLAPEVLARLRDAFAGGPERGPRDWTSWLGAQCDDLTVLPFPLTGRYVNVNSRDDLNLANALARDATFDDRWVSLVYLVNAPESVAPAPILEFADNDAIDEVLVVAQQPPHGVDAAAVHPKVRLLVPPARDLPMGALVTFGLDAARGDILILCYSDGTFAPRDVDKLLVYLRDADLVMGTRTTRQMIEQGTNMRGVVRAAHVVLAKVLEVAWWRFESRVTDIACVYRALWRSTYRAIRPQLTATGVEVLPEMVIEVLRARRRIVEIPVTYRNPDVEQPHVRSPYQRPAVFRRILGLIVRKRLAETAIARRLRRRPIRPESSRSPEALRYKQLEKEWQDGVGHDMLDVPHDLAGAHALADRQFERLFALLDDVPPGPIVEVGCGKGHLLGRLRATRPERRSLLLGLDVSRAVMSLPPQGLAGCMADGEFLPLRTGSVAALLFAGSLHHIIDYGAAIREAVRVLRPGGLLVVHEPLTSWFSRAMHGVLDPIVFRLCTQYESPIDIRYKGVFREDVVVRVLREERMSVADVAHSDFLAYPFTGCYAGSVFSRSKPLMERLMALESLLAGAPVVGRVGRALAWRFTVVAVKAA